MEVQPEARVETPVSHVSLHSSNVRAPASCSLQASAIGARALITRRPWGDDVDALVTPSPPTKLCGPAHRSKGLILGHTRQ